ncbi:MAG: hypothetical protein AAF456_12170 [Planctomycetota bacterium]
MISLCAFARDFDLRGIVVVVVISIGVSLFACGFFKLREKQQRDCGLVCPFCEHILAPNSAWPEQLRSTGMCPNCREQIYDIISKPLDAG